MNISLPASLKKWVEEEVESGGYGTASEFVRDVLRRQREQSMREAIDQHLLESMKTPVSEVTEKTWDEIRAAGLKKAGKRTKR